MAQTILVIEDDEGASDLAKAVLESAGYEVILAADGKVGVKTALARKPDLVLVDLMLPGMHGFAVCEKLRSEASLSGLRIMVVTSKAYTQDMDSAADAGADGYVTKPYKPDDLVAKVRMLLSSPDGKDRSASPQSNPSTPA